MKLIIIQYLFNVIKMKRNYAFKLILHNIRSLFMCSQLFNIFCFFFFNVGKISMDSINCISGTTAFDYHCNKLIVSYNLVLIILNK